MSGRLRVFEPSREQLAPYAEVYQTAFAAPPWEEAYDRAEVLAYLAGFCAGGALHCFALEEDGQPLGVALAVVVPCVGAPFLRVEDFCIAGKRQRQGFGAHFLRALAREAEGLGCDSILLSTQRDFPAYRFYVKNGLQEIKSSALLYGETARLRGE